MRVIPDLDITITDFDELTMKRVSAVVPEFKDAEVFDVTKGDFSQFKDKYDSVLLFTVTFLFKDREMGGLFKNISLMGCKQVFIITASTLSSGDVVKSVVKQVIKPFFPRLVGRFLGYGRTKAGLLSVVRANKYYSVKKVAVVRRNNKDQLFIHLVKRPVESN
tara:strand:+ start:231 stop:719 length:489 start_codon:yes stop_codon:yes gene_type:complete